MTDHAIMLAMVDVENQMAKLIAERAVAVPEGPDRRFLRGLWQFCNARSNYLLEMTCDASN